MWCETMNVQCKQSNLLGWCRLSNLRALHTAAPARGLHAVHIHSRLIACRYKFHTVPNVNFLLATCICFEPSWRAVMAGEVQSDLVQVGWRAGVLIFTALARAHKQGEPHAQNNQQKQRALATCHAPLIVRRSLSVIGVGLQSMAPTATTHDVHSSLLTLNQHQAEARPCQPTQRGAVESSRSIVAQPPRRATGSPPKNECSPSKSIL
jgi:hypothetical protein